MPSTFYPAGREGYLRPFFFFLVVLLFVGSLDIQKALRFVASVTNEGIFDSWKTSSHNKVSCLNCHRSPGLLISSAGKVGGSPTGHEHISCWKGIKNPITKLMMGIVLQKVVIKETT